MRSFFSSSLFSVIAGFLGCLGVWVIFGYDYPVPKSLATSIDFISHINNGEEWLKDNIRDYTKAGARVVNVMIEAMTGFLQRQPWPVLPLSLTLLALYFGSLRLALLTLIGVMYWGMVGMWDQAISTLSLVLISVALSVSLGIPLGVLAAKSNRFEASLRPILDTMQTMPAFVYLLPAIFLFGTGQTGAAITIIIYALPPVVRLTNLGIRQVPAGLIEVSRSFGATPLQTLIKVQIPSALPSIILGINQTMMMALGLAVLAVFIGTDGLEREVFRALTKLKTGWSFEAGMGIVFMAIIFDRLTIAMSERSGDSGIASRGGMQFRLFAESWSRFAIFRWLEAGIDVVWRLVAFLGYRVVGLIAWLSATLIGFAGALVQKKIYERIISMPFLLISLLLLAFVYCYDGLIASIGSYPEALMFSMRKAIDDWVISIVTNHGFAAFSKNVRWAIFTYMLNPVNQFLYGLPWFFVLGVLFVMALRASGWIFAFVVTALMGFTVIANIWEPTLQTLSATLVSVLICFILAMPLGVAMAGSKLASQMIKPILDFMQTLPAFVYLVPAIMLFGGSRSTAILATVIYAVPPIARLTALGLSQIPQHTSEVCESYGSTRLQQLLKVKLPIASPSIILGVNQSIVMALAMQSITPMIGGRGLGREVFAGMTTANTGLGLIAGIGIALLAIILDRLTNAWTVKQRQALGL